jgi:signal transduction histidine kinase
LQLILEEIERMEITIHGLLDLSRTTPMCPTTHSLRETLTRAAQLVAGRAARQRVTIHLETGSDPLMVDGDVQQLHQVCVNLYLNAIESMPEGGVLRIRAERGGNPPRARIEVRDSGPGIREDLLPRLFEPFVTSKERGTGLGLAISQRIIESHGGTIRAENAPEGGAVFFLDIPLNEQAPLTATAHRRSELSGLPA